MGLTGLEPVTSALSGQRSNRLSYRPNSAVSSTDLQQYRTCRLAQNFRLAERIFGQLELDLILGESDFQTTEQVRRQVIQERAEGGDRRQQHDIDRGNQCR